MTMCAAGILVRNDRILLGKRSANRTFYPNVWDGIGGHCHPGESPEQTLIRELAEELGIVPRTWRPLAVLHDPEPDRHGAYEYAVYVVTEWHGMPTNMAPDEHAEIRWFRICEAVHLDLAHPDYPALFSMIERGIWEGSSGDSK